MQIREYLKLSRSFNAVLTAVSPVMGALAINITDIGLLFLLFLIGFFGHTFGFVFNDILDYNIDKHEKELKDRPLISGTISIKKAWAYALISLGIALSIGIYIAYSTGLYLSLVILVISCLLVVMYDLISKKIPGTDLIIGTGVFFFVLYGASTQVPSLYYLPLLVWIMCLLGGIQVVFMNIVAGGLKDIENDFKKGANTIAIKLGVRVTNTKLTISKKFSTLAYLIQLINIIAAFLPLVLITYFRQQTPLIYIQWILLSLVSVFMLFFSHKLLSQKTFKRDDMRKLIGLHYYTNFGLAPIVLMTINPWILLMVLFPALGFILSNLILHGTVLQPKTM